MRTPLDHTCHRGGGRLHRCAGRCGRSRPRPGTGARRCRNRNRIRHAPPPNPPRCGGVRFTGGPSVCCGRHVASVAAAPPAPGQGGPCRRSSRRGSSRRGPSRSWRREVAGRAAGRSIAAGASHSPRRCGILQHPPVPTRRSLGPPHQPGSFRAVRGRREADFVRRRRCERRLGLAALVT